MSEHQHEDQEVVFRRREGEELLRGRMCIANGIVSVTAPDGRQKSTQLAQKSSQRVQKSTQRGGSPALSFHWRVVCSTSLKMNGWTDLSCGKVQKPADAWQGKTRQTSPRLIAW